MDHRIYSGKPNWEQTLTQVQYGDSDLGMIAYKANWWNTCPVGELSSGSLLGIDSLLKDSIIFTSGILFSQLIVNLYKSTKEDFEKNRGAALGCLDNIKKRYKELNP